MSLKTILNYTITAIFLIGIWGASDLVIDEIQTGNGCPKIWVIPACVIILLCFLIPLVVHLLKKYNRIYFAFTGLAFSIAIYASIMQLTGRGSCPTTEGGTPMCYLSFLVFSILIVLKIISLKNNNKSI